MPYFNNNPYQQSYNNPYQQSYVQNQQSYAQNSYAQPQIGMAQPSQSSTINWVQGDVGARAYPIQPGMSVLLMDSEGQNFYIKSADTMGMPSLKKYAYSEVVEEPMRLESHEAKQIDTAFTATREEVKQMQEEIKHLKEQIAQMEKSGVKKNG